MSKKQALGSDSPGLESWGEEAMSLIFLPAEWGRAQRGVRGHQGRCFLCRDRCAVPGGTCLTQSLPRHVPLSETTVVQTELFPSPRTQLHPQHTPAHHALPHTHTTHSLTPSLTHTHSHTHIHSHTQSYTFIHTFTPRTFTHTHSFTHIHSHSQHTLIHAHSRTCTHTTAGSEECQP